MQKLIAITAVLVCLAAGAAPAAAVPASPGANTGATPFAFPINVVSTDQGTFTGTFKIERFAVVGTALVASGSVVGTLIDENGITTAIYRTVTVPVDLNNLKRGDAPLGCDILHLELGPLDLDLLGLVVHLNKIVLDIDAEPGAGNLLGNLLCAIVGLLDGSNLSLLAQLLNQLLAILG